jgi:uncharacterized protein (DUF305 family)
MHARRILVSAATLALTAFAAGCGSDHGMSHNSSGSASAPAASAPAAAEGAAALLNAAEVEFAQGMIAHHEQAIEMAEVALDPNTNAGAEVLDLAKRIKAAQDPEVTLMTGWLTAAGMPTTMDMSGGHSMDDMEGMMSAEDMDSMAAMTGDEFDAVWLQMMIAHHEGAISQSETVKSKGSNPDVLSARQVIRLTAGSSPTASPQAEPATNVSPCPPNATTR